MFAVITIKICKASKMHIKTVSKQEEKFVHILTRTGIKHSNEICWHNDSTDLV